jgi:phage replication-related protein YjqB (UPF0714/DUF867 family)
MPGETNERRDHYGDFASLISAERESEDYGRIVRDRRSPIAIVAPHGGAIEGGTSEIARALAGSEHSLYCFEGRKTIGNEHLHICSTRFDDPRCLQIVRSAVTVISVHGCRDETPRCWVGGLDDLLASRLLAALRSEGFDAERDTTEHAGMDPMNLCNRGTSGRGIQFEIARGLRGTMFAGPRRRDRTEPLPVFHSFVATVRGVLGSV